MNPDRKKTVKMMLINPDQINNIFNTYLLMRQDSACLKKQESALKCRQDVVQAILQNQTTASMTDLKN